MSATVLANKLAIQKLKIYISKTQQLHCCAFALHPRKGYSNWDLCILEIHKDLLRESRALDSFKEIHFQILISLFPLSWNWSAYECTSPMAGFSSPISTYTITFSHFIKERHTSPKSLILPQEIWNIGVDAKAMNDSHYHVTNHFQVQVVLWARPCKGVGSTHM